MKRKEEDVVTIHGPIRFRVPTEEELKKGKKVERLDYREEAKKMIQKKKKKENQ